MRVRAAKVLSLSLVIFSVLSNLVSLPALTESAPGPQPLAAGADGFALAWLTLLIYVTVQPLWAPPRSWTGFVREWMAFASLWTTYALARSEADGRLVRAMLWGALLNAAVNVVFAEVQVRGLSTPYFFMAPVPGHYIGNTGQQNMFALWMAIAGTGGLSLLLSRERRGLAAGGALTGLLAVVFWGLVGSTSRSGILSLAAGAAVLGAFHLRLRGRRAAGPILLGAALFAAALAGSVSLNDNTAAALVSKMEDVVQRPLSFANRDSIWATSWTMFVRSPVRGVGLGQYKWHYIDAQNEMLKRWPQFKWQFTNWAHNEFLQWMAEGGVVGAAIMFFMWGWWLLAAARAFRRRAALSDEAAWGSALAALFMVNALWTRPFHRVEDVIWLALAFAVTNRELMAGRRTVVPNERSDGGKQATERALFPVRVDRLSRGACDEGHHPVVPNERSEEGPGCEVTQSKIPRFARDDKRGFAHAARNALRLLGATMCSACLAGLIYLGNGLYANRLMRLTTFDGVDADEVFSLLERARRSPMMRDAAEERIAYFKVGLGEAMEDANMLTDGLNELVNCFMRQPDTKELSFLQDWAWKLGDPEFINFIQSFVYRPSADESNTSGE